jgi:hypothetical protein
MGARGPVPKAKPDHANAGYKRGIPKMPTDLTAEAREIWQWICRQIPKDRSSPADKITILGLTRWFVQWDRLMASLDQDPGDFRTQRQAATAWNLVDQACRQMGFTLVSRARLPAGGSEKKAKTDDTGLAKILSIREGKRRPG